MPSPSAILLARPKRWELVAGGCELNGIVTRDKKGFSKASLPVYSVAELMERIESEGE